MRPPIKVFYRDKETKEVLEKYNYLTPEEWEAETGEKMLNSDCIWVWKEYHDNYPFGNLVKAEWIIEHMWYERDEITGNNICVVARPGQPKPDDSWRPE